MTNINADRFWTELNQLAEFSETTLPGVTRVLYSPEDVAAKDYLKSIMADAGLSIRQDAVGNIFARWQGLEPALTPVGTGSHIDATPNSGRFDGTVGVMGALEAVRALKAAGFVPRRSIEVIVFAAEEPTRFGISCLGSRVLAGALPVSRLDTVEDAAGNRFEDVRVAAGCRGTLASVPITKGCYHAFLELHIEQGPILEKEKIPIGVVTSIAAPAALKVVFEGPGGHAGTVLMHQRRDSSLAAAELVIAVEAAAVASSSTSTVATTGILNVEPNAINSIPRRATLGIDVRDTDVNTRNKVLEHIRRTAQNIADQRRLTYRCETIAEDPPAKCDSKLIQILENSCRQLGIAFIPIVSRAYHDSLFMGQIAPMGMIFVPSRGGISHHPDEYSSMDEIRTGVQILAQSLADLSLQ
jgi:ureidoglycolate amidohydrolase